MPPASAYPPIVWADVVKHCGVELDAVEPTPRANILEHVNSALNTRIHTRARLRLRRIYLAAHFGTLSIPAVDAGAGGNTGQEYAGPIVSEKVDNIERRFGSSSSDTSSGGFDMSESALNATPWGVQFLGLRPARARLPFTT